MEENLVIVESPAKARTIEKFLGKGFTVKSSYGHIRDLCKKGLGIDIDNNFEPNYEIPADKKKVVAELRSLAGKSKTVWLASDEDREGEAIAWHLAQVLELDPDKTKRIVFHEITKQAILDAVENPRHIDMDLVNAQQARRILDRLVGFELSPVLWRKVKPSLSAGRVQSVAVKLIVEREREIINFTPEVYFRVTAEFRVTDKDGKKSKFKAELARRLKTQEEALSLLEHCKTALFTIGKVEKKPAQRYPAPPFTTSTLQQEAGRKLSMSVGQTMSVAQKLYEAGYITYMRTDSVNLSSQAKAAAEKAIKESFGEKYSHPRNYKTSSKGAQEAHEAIRPSYMDRVDIDGTAQEKRLYDLIRKRTLASQMSPAEIERTLVDIEISDSKERFTAAGEVIKFDGFLRLYSESSEDEEAQDQAVLLPDLNPGDHPEAMGITARQSFTQSPARYSEASLVKRLEELGIGRPSTYAPTISTIIARGYVVKENRPGVVRDYTVIKLEKGEITTGAATETVGKEKSKLSPTDIGMIVTDYLAQQFEAIMDYNFTASVEKEFDEIAEGQLSLPKMLTAFYGGFHDHVNRALESEHVKSSQARLLGEDPKTGKPVYVKIARFGPVAQIGDSDEDEKPKYASLKKGQLIASITLEEALALFQMPRTIGEFEDKEVVVGIGKFGPYVRHDGKFTSLAKTDDPYTIELDRAITLIEEKRVKDIAKNTPLRVFPEDPDTRVLNGRYGPYIVSGGKNYRIPKDYDPAALTLEQCREIIDKSKK